VAALVTGEEAEVDEAVDEVVTGDDSYVEAADLDRVCALFGSWILFLRILFGWRIVVRCDVINEWF